MEYVWIELTKDVPERDSSWRKGNKVQVTRKLFAELKGKNQCKLILSQDDEKEEEE